MKEISFSHSFMKQWGSAVQDESLTISDLFNIGKDLSSTGSEIDNNQILQSNLHLANVKGEKLELHFTEFSPNPYDIHNAGDIHEKVSLHLQTKDLCIKLLIQKWYSIEGLQFYEAFNISETLQTNGDICARPQPISLDPPSITHIATSVLNIYSDILEEKRQDTQKLRASIESIVIYPHQEKPLIN